MKKVKYIPISAVCEITLRCNMKCMHCGSTAGNARNKELTTNEWFDVMEQLHQLGTKVVTLMGGEPLLRKDWHLIAKKIKDLGMDVVIISNGFIINEKIVAQLKSLEPYAVSISIDGAQPHTHDSIRGMKGSFQRCLKSLDLLRKADIPTSVITTVHKQNVQELPRLRDILEKRGIAWQIQMATPIGRFSKKFLLSKEEFYAVGMFISSTRNRYSRKDMPVVGAHNFGYHSKVLRNIMITPLWKGCQAGISSIGVQSNGGIKGCLSLPDEFIEDSIHRRKLTDIWNDDRCFSYTRKCKIPIVFISLKKRY